VCGSIDLLRFFFFVSLSFFVENNPRRPGGVGVCSVFSDLTWCSIPGYFSYGCTHSVAETLMGYESEFQDLDFC
jgi:hypothetical protein